MNVAIVATSVRSPASEVTVERARPSIACCRRASTTTVTAWKSAKASAIAAKPAGAPDQRAGRQERRGRRQHVREAAAAQAGARGRRAAPPAATPA